MLKTPWEKNSQRRWVHTQNLYATEGNDPPPMKVSGYKNNHSPRAEVDETILNRLYTLYMYKVYI